MKRGGAGCLDSVVMPQDSRAMRRPLAKAGDGSRIAQPRYRRRPIAYSVFEQKNYASVADFRNGGRDKQQRHNLLHERVFRTHRAPRDQPEYFFFHLRFHFGPPLASGTGMHRVNSRRLAVLTLQDRWKRGRCRPCDNKLVISKNFLKFHNLSI